MSAISYHNDVVNFQRSFEWKFMSKFRGFLSSKIPTLESFVSRKMVNIFAKLHVQLKEILDDLDGYSPEEVGRLYEDLQGLVPQLIKSHERFSELSFLNNETLESQMRKTLDLTYILEARSKKIVKSKKKGNRISEDELKAALSYTSKKNIATKLT